jgi:hypothetical protein
MRSMTHVSMRFEVNRWAELIGRHHFLSIFTSYDLQCDVASGMADETLLRCEVFTAVTMKNVIFWDVTPCGSCKDRRFEGT